MDGSEFRLLKTRRYLPIFLTQLFGSFNDNIFKNAVIILMAYQLSSSASHAQLLVTIAGGIFIFPFFLFSATAGQLADRYEKAGLILKVKFAEVIISLFIFVGLYYHQTYLLITLLFLLGTQASFFGPLKYSILPLHLQENELIGGTGMIEASTFLTILLGTILGGIFIVLPHGEIIISLIVFVFALAGFVSSFYILKTKDNPDIIVNYNFITETFRVIRYSMQHSLLFYCIIGIGWFWLLGAVFLAEFPVFTKNIIHGDEYVVTLFISIFSIGIAIGSLLCNFLLKGKVSASYVTSGTFGISVFIIDLFFSANHFPLNTVPTYLTPMQLLQSFSGWRICLDLLLLSICGGLYTVPLYAILQNKSDRSYRARVIASNNVVSSLFIVLGAIGTVICFKLHLTVNHIFLLLGIFNLIIVFVIRRLKQLL